MYKLSIKLNLTIVDVYIYTTQVLCVFLFLGSTFSEPDTFLDQMLRNSNSDELLNSVLGRLEQNRPDLLAKQGVIEEEDCNEPAEVMVLAQFEVHGTVTYNTTTLTYYWFVRRSQQHTWLLVGHASYV